MANIGDVREVLDKLAPGSEVKVELDDGSEVAGTFKGLDGDLVQLEGDDVQLDKVQTVRMSIGDVGPE